MGAKRVGRVSLCGSALPAASSGKRVCVTRNYFDDVMINRQRLLFAIATRRQLDRWEPIVAAHVRRLMGDRQLDDPDIWAAEIEHHFLLIAARNLLRALELPPSTNVTVDQTLRAELIEGRDLHEHWTENLPIFNVRPRPAQPPRRSGRDFAARNPDAALTTGSHGAAGRAPGSFPTSQPLVSTSSSTRSRRRSSRLVRRSLGSCRPGFRRRGFTSRASGGRSRSRLRSRPGGITRLPPATRHRHRYGVHGRAARSSRSPSR